jgi:hypothetical protein
MALCLFADYPCPVLSSGCHIVQGPVHGSESLIPRYKHSHGHTHTGTESIPSLLWLIFSWMLCSFSVMSSHFHSNCLCKCTMESKKYINTQRDSWVDEKWNNIPMAFHNELSYSHFHSSLVGNCHSPVNGRLKKWRILPTTPATT